MGLLGHCRDPIGKSGSCPGSAKMAKDSNPLKTFTGVPLGRSVGDRSSGRRPTRTLTPGATTENGTGSYCAGAATVECNYCTLSNGNRGQRKEEFKTASISFRSSAKIAFGACFKYLFHIDNFVGSAGRIRTYDQPVNSRRVGGLLAQPGGL